MSKVVENADSILSTLYIRLEALDVAVVNSFFPQCEMAFDTSLIRGMEDRIMFHRVPSTSREPVTIQFRDLHQLLEDDHIEQPSTLYRQLEMIAEYVCRTLVSSEATFL